MRILAVAILCGAMLGRAAVRAEEGPDPAVPVEQDKPAAAAASTEKPWPPIEYIYLRGIAFRTPDKLFELAIGFNLQTRFTSFDFDAVPGATADADEFRIRRFKLYFTGYAFDPKLTYRVQLAFENVNNTRLLLDDAFVNYKFMDEIAAQMGQSKTPYSRDELYNDGVIQFQERALAVDTFKPGRDAGAGILGPLFGGKLMYMAAVFGGDGQNTLRASDHVMPMVRLVANPIGKITPASGEMDLECSKDAALSFGVDGFTNTLRKLTDIAFELNTVNYASATGWLGRNIGLFTIGEDVFVESASADVQFKWMGFSAQAEYFAGHAEGDTSGVRVRANGWYGQAGYFVLPGKVDLAVRYSVVDDNQGAPHNENSIVTAAADWYVRRNNVKLQFDYSRTHRQRPVGEPANDQLFRFQVQLML
jgi:phosphate-selective porin OprO and OprP